MTAFEVLVLGVGDSFSQKHHGASLLLRAGEQYLAIDCPDPYRLVLNQAAKKANWQVDIDSIQHFAITHVHGDHMNGLEGVAYFKHFVEQKKLSLIASQELRNEIWEHRLSASMGTLWNGTSFRRLHFEDYFEFHALDWSAEIKVGPYSIRARRTVHHVPTSALLITAEGRTLGYSADTAFDPSLIQFLSSADLIIHETNFGPAHTDYELLAQLPAELRSKMRLIHYSDGFDVTASAIAPLTEGSVLRV